MNRLSGKVAIITGGNAGVGEAIAKLFAREGASVVISARRAEPLQKVADAVIEEGGSVLPVPTDISKVEDVKNLMEKAIEKFGKIDILVNNAGVLDQNLNSIAQIDYADLDKVININEKGTAYCLSEALKKMKKGASIINVASVAGQYGCGGAAYVATKAAVIGLTKHTAMRYAKEEIRCNVICPGTIKTSMASSLNRETMDAQMMGAMMAHSDLSVPPCEPEDVANVALFLASDESRALTGQVIVSDFGADL
ncbi:MAG: SDR family oxidoreductase [Anaerostipes sp.]|nr:SDR family oxidoreductase [Anaerostipes sp.]